MGSVHHGPRFPWLARGNCIWSGGDFIISDVFREIGTIRAHVVVWGFHQKLPYFL